MSTGEIRINRLSYEIGRSDGNRLNIILRIDGKPFNEYFHISNTGFCLSPDEFINSLYNPGRYFIFTCDCGDPGCAGWFKGIQVDATAEYFTWLIEEKVPEPIKLVFFKNQYTKLIDSLRSELDARAGRNPRAQFE
jgi:hypothetical protein